MTELVIHNARIMTCDAGRLDLGMIDHGAVVVSGGTITWVGHTAQRPRGCVATAAARRAQRVVPTLLAHVVPPERAHARDAFVAELCQQLIPRTAERGLAASVDVYCDEGAFTLTESRAILTAARAAG